MAEVVKCALAGDAELWDRLVAAGGAWKAIEGEEWRWIVRRAVAFKASVVERDEKEASLRRILNLGHTIGHAMEKSGGYGRLLHGEAVAMGLAWEAILGMKLGVTGEELVDGIVSLLIAMGFPLDDPGVALTSIAAAIGLDKKRMMADVDLPLVAAPGRCELRRVPLAVIRRELPGIRAEIRERSIARELNVPAGMATPEEHPVSNLVHVGDEVYEIRPVEEEVAPPVPAETGPGSGREGAEAEEPERAAVQALEPGLEPPPESPPPEFPPGSSVRTVTLADLYWSQGEETTARRIVGEILRDDPANLRAQAWLAARAGDDLVEAELLGFLETMAKEYGYDLS
jgi:hypothetical protein